MKKVKPQWVNYNEWEDYKNNMYHNRILKEKETECYNLLTNNNLKEKMEQTTIDYPISTKVNFTNKMFNPVSWLGQATCNLHFNATARETISAWLCMNKDQQENANMIAKEVIREWVEKYENI